jgi:hypothetical protein
VLKALLHVMSDFPGLSLQDRVAILVPDNDFLDGLRPALSEALQAASVAGQFGKFGSEKRRLVLMNASEAASRLTGRAGGRGRHGEGDESLVFDTLESFDGLERLIVIPVGLDAPLDDKAEDVLETRSRLYRALTRAHMMALVVNEAVKGGWLEWLKVVRLQKDALFDRAAEMARQQANAAERVVSMRVNEIQAALQTAVAKQLARQVSSWRR